MAEGVLLNILAGFVANVASEPFKYIRLPFWFKKELRKLEATITMIKAVLLDAEEKKDTNNQVKVWLESLEDVIYDADNLVDKFRYQQLRRKVLFGKKRAKKVRIFFSRSNQLVFRVKMANKIKQIRETLDEIKANQVFSQLDKCEHGETRTFSSIMSGRETHSFVTTDEVIGRDNDKKVILDFLLGNNLEAKESVTTVSLVGIGGLGKTTLAQLVYNDELVKKNFEKTIWVCVSDVFDLKLLIQKIIRSVDNTSPDHNLDLDQLQNQLRLKIQDKRYLLVLDDVWNQNSDQWEKLETFLKLGAQGSKVLITTRSIRVAEIVHSTKTYMLKGLDKNKSWALFDRVAFRGINKSNSQYHGLVEVGRDIVDKCKGVPLAIKTIGRLLESKIHSSQNPEKVWIHFRDNELAKVAFPNDSDIVPTLKLSYNSLPSHLKHCFAYCSLFPKDYRINVQELIELWIAQGFIVSDSTRQLEDIGYEYFMILFWGCFFQEAETAELSPTTIEYCKMHDLMHDLASLVAGKGIKIFDVNTSNIELVENAFEKVCHVSVDFTDYISSWQIPKLLFEQKKMRTFILRDAKSLSSSTDHIVSNFRLLRALSLLDIKTLPKSLGKLNHLRFLDLSFSAIVELPSSITELYYLQTLKLCQCPSLVCLPANLQNLINLRHLEIARCHNLTRMPRGIGELSSLQSLDTFIVADNKSSESAAGFDELSKLNNLHGGLTIEIRGLGDSKAAKCLTDKEHLEFLHLNWEVEESMGNAEETFDRLEPPQNIKAIGVYDYPGETFPGNWFSSLTDLVRLELYSCRTCKYLPPLHHLSSLKELTLDGLSSLEYVSEKDNHDWSRGDQPEPLFPSLVKLNLNSCGNLQGWWRGETEDFCEALTPHQQLSFPKLSIVEIRRCPILNSMPPFPNLEKLSLYVTSSKPLERMSRMKLKVYDSVEETFSASSSSIPSSSSPSALSKLEYLSIKYVNDLESLLSEAQIHNLASLQYLEIESCSNLTLIPNGIGSLSSLTELTIKYCSNLTSILNEIGSLSSLTRLEIKYCRNLTSIPNEIGSLSSLRDLGIIGCSNLTSIPNGIGSLSSLTSLAIVDCSNLTSIPNEIGSLSSLRDLEIDFCPKLTSIPNEIGSLSSLRDLGIIGCSNLTSIPNGIGSLSSLTSLKIVHCSNLTSIPNEIGSLSSLRDLKIDFCPKLTSIPNEIGSLPALKSVNRRSCTEIPMDALADFLLRENSPAPHV